MIPEQIGLLKRGAVEIFSEADTIKLRCAGCTKQITSLENAVKDYVQNYLRKMLIPRRLMQAKPDGIL